MNTTSIFFNQSFDKKRLKAFLYWVFKTFGEKEALTVVEQLKTMGFYNATKAGLSIGLHDLKTPYKKKLLISHAQIAMRKTDQEFQGAEVTATERSQRIVDTWHRTSEDLRKQVVDYFSTYDQLNSVYMMALSGARGNFSQVRQLIGMRGLMADPQGQIISFPIRSNLREGLTLTEYFISCSGARKGLVDTALRTADTGYLTRRLVDISHHIVVKKVTCYTSRGIALKTLRTPQKTLLALRDRLVGRVLAENIYSSNKIELDSEQVHSEHSALHQNQVTSSQIESHAKRSFANQIQTKLHKANPLTRFTKTTKQPEPNDQRGTQSGALLKLIARKNQEISPDLAFQISSVKENLLHGERETALSGTRESQNRGLTNLTIPQVLVRSPLTCTYTHEVCQLCYGWSMAQGSLVSLGEAVGVIAGQSIGEPGTQLTMRTFHTGGVFSGDLLQEIRAPHSGKILFPKALQGLLIRTSQGKIAFLIKVAGELLVDSSNLDSQVEKGPITKLPLAPSTILFVRQGETVKSHQILAELAITTEQGNQPIKSRQTLFSEIGGRIVQWKSMTSRVHRTKGVPERSSSKAQQGLSINGNRVMQKVRYPVPKQGVSGTGQSQNKVLVLTQPTATTKQNTKPGIQAHIGPVQSTHNSQHLVLNKSDFMNQANTKTSLHKNEGVPRQSKALAQRAFGVQSEALYVRQPLYMQRLVERNGQHDQETWGRLNNLTLKKTALTKRNGLGSIEPPKALKLGLLGVIATRVGASENTCTKPVFSNPTTTLISTLKTAVTQNKSGNLAGSNKRNKVLLTEKDAKHLDTHMTCLHHLNTIAEEGDLVDENYTQM